MTTLTKDEFTRTLTKALNHQPRFYSKIDGLSFRYEATRAQPAERVVEVLAAVKAKDTVLGEDTAQHESFSSKLVNYLARCKEHVPNSIDFAVAIAAISAESPSRKPTHEIVFGDTSIGAQLGSLPQDRTATSPSQAVLQYYAVVQVHLADVFNDENCQKLSKWTRQLDPDHPITVERAYETDDSTLLILTMPYNVFLRTGLGERYLIGLVKGCAVDRSKC